MPYAVSIFWGIMTAVILFLGAPLLLLSEMGGPSSFAFPILFLVVLVLAIGSYTARAKGGLQGAACGLLFAIPVALVCIIFSRADEVHREHGGELLAVAGISVFVS